MGFVPAAMGRDCRTDATSVAVARSLAWTCYNKSSVILKAAFCTAQVVDAFRRFRSKFSSGRFLVGTVLADERWLRFEAANTSNDLSVYTEDRGR